MVKSRSYIATPPGATIKEQLIDRGMSQKEFAARMNMSEKHISKLINGEVQLTSDAAFRLEIVLGVPARFWLNLEAIYREKIVKAEAENALDLDMEMVKNFPYHEMVKLGWLPEAKTAQEQVIHLRKFFEVVELSLLENEQITRIACRKLAIAKTSDLSLMAWVQQARHLARDLQTASVKGKNVSAGLPELQRFALEGAFPELQNRCAEHGIALVLLPGLPGGFPRGATFLDGNKIVIALTGDRWDPKNHCFDFFHELAHIVLGHIGNVNGTTPEEEQAADTWARNRMN